MTADDKYCAKILSFISSKGLKQHVLDPTRYNPDNILDLCLSNTSIISDVKVGELFSDHRLLTITLSISIKRQVVTRSVLNFKKADYTAINYYLSNINWNYILSSAGATMMYDTFLQILMNLINIFVPTIVIKPLVRRHGIAIMKLQKSKLKIRRLEGNSLAYKEASNMLKKELLLKDQCNTEKCLVNGSSNDFYRFINKRMHVTEDVGLLVNKNRNIIDDYEKAEIFSSTFAEVFTVDNGIFPIMNENVRTNLSDMVFEPYMVERELSMLKSRCNTSPDDVPAIFLKRLCTSIALPLSIIFNASMRSGDVPMLWKEAIVKPLYKKGGRTDPCNYRPISLTSSVSKTMERLIRRNIVSYLNKHSLLHDSQFGFRNNRSTESQLLEYNRKRSLYIE
uniref:Reverse transcriptase domain-containing protein n=1 Tax=Caenorhabditis japonica TaxID=281687 RepID=A0A8R1DH77_CAEJA